jgi:CheY-like chemotaxis protein
MTRTKTPPLVLLVEDYQDAREMYADYLRFSGYRVAEASNGIEALALAAELRPAIVLMDLALPQLDGWEATRRLKRDPETRHIPVVALTGHALPEHQDGARNAGCDAFITKPCLPDALVVEIQRVLKAAHAPAVPAAAAAAPAARKPRARARLGARRSQ